MWTSTWNANLTQNWSPNHFVPCYDKNSITVRHTDSNHQDKSLSMSNTVGSFPVSRSLSNVTISSSQDTKMKLSDMQISSTLELPRNAIRVDNQIVPAAHSPTFLSVSPQTQGLSVSPKSNTATTSASLSVSPKSNHRH